MLRVHEYSDRISIVISWRKTSEIFGFSTVKLEGFWNVDDVQREKIHNGKSEVIRRVSSYNCNAKSVDKLVNSPYYLSRSPNVDSCPVKSKMENLHHPQYCSNKRSKDFPASCTRNCNLLISIFQFIKNNFAQDESTNVKNPAHPDAQTENVTSHVIHRIGPAHVKSFWRASGTQVGLRSDVLRME